MIVLILPVGLRTGGPRARALRMDATTLERRTALAREWVLNEGFYAPCKEELMSPDFVFMGPVVGPLNKVDYC